jgi:protoporphyrinogen oxidase
MDAMTLVDAKSRGEQLRPKGINDAASIEDVPVLILGAGLAGLAAAATLGDSALVLERDARPGGLVRTECFKGYWFDRVIHLLYFADAHTERRILDLLGSDLQPCPPLAWVECSAGTARFPLQLHLGSLDPRTVVECLVDFINLSLSPEKSRPQNFEELLLQQFGRTMCDTFFFPYNRKMWKRPLNTLAPSGFQWNVVRPDLAEILRGAVDSASVSPSYNAAGWYPRPPHGSAVRGMEVLSHRLAKKVHDLRLQHAVETIDLENRVVTVRTESASRRFRFSHRCLATLPLPEIVSKCRQAPTDLLHGLAKLRRNRVLSVAFSIVGPRPSGRGHWRYYTDESVSFTRLVYLHEFDPDCAPAEGWSLLAEITEPAERALMPPDQLLSLVQADLSLVGALPSGCRIIDTHLLVIDPAYVVFSVDDEDIVERARAFLLSHGVVPLGRYGRWEYSSMGQVMRDGFSVAEKIKAEMVGIAGSCA